MQTWLVVKSVSNLWGNISTRSVVLLQHEVCSGHSGSYWGGTGSLGVPGAGIPWDSLFTFSGILLLVQIVGPVSSSVLKWVVLCLEWLLGGDVLAGGPRFLLSINHVLSLYFINDCVLFMCLAQDSASSVPLLIAYCVCMYELVCFLVVWCTLCYWDVCKVHYK